MLRVGSFFVSEITLTLRNVPNEQYFTRNDLLKRINVKIVTVHPSGYKQKRLIES